MSTVKTNNVQIGQSATATNNFTWYQPASPDGTVRLGNGNAGAVTDAVTVNSSGQVGIGTVNPLTRLTVQGPVDTTFAPNVFNTRLIGTSSATSGNSGSGIAFMGYYVGTTSVVDLAFVSGIKENITDANYAGALIFGTRPNGSGGGSMERMRITSDGYVLVATTSRGSNTSTFYVNGSFGGQGLTGRQGTGGTSSGNAFNFWWNSTVAQLWIDNVNIGNISVTSDYRTKDHVETQIEPAIERVLQLRPVTYQIANYGTLFKADGKVREGFIAHELAEVVPSAVEGEKDDPKQIQSLRLDALCSVLTKAIQEQQATIEDLRARLAALEAK